MDDHEKQTQDAQFSNTSTDNESNSQTPTPTLTNPGPPPDGGFTAWLHVFLTHLVFFNSWGFANSYGIFQEYYTVSLAQSSSSIAWIGSVQVFLAHAVCVGLGNGLSFCPALSVLSTYFKNNRALAVGIAAAGGASGGLVYPAAVHVLLGKVGFAWTLRIVGFIMLAAHVPSIFLFKPRLPPYKAGALVEWAAFKEPAYTFFTMGMFFNYWGLYFAFFYLGTFARDRLGATTETSVNLLMILNGIGIIGRIIPNLIGDRITGPFNILIPFSFAACILVYCWAAVDSISGMYPFAIIYGFVAAALQALLPATATILATDPKKTGVRLGMILSVVSFACLTGPPISGALIQAGGGNYLYAQIFAGTSIALSGLCLVASRVSKSGWSWVKV
ncbi:putative mfs monocarboxylate transporter protein [Botrytis fragariae]|uniref:Putative mfs monocarboxylate transporter protein n=1 Tax=Botrytis fragariae TaxID=1964551 RepID=A0A8H6EDP9_9HELO|nr:putative mfs monocarboxylate transporter protein [Botrytis fragariae]KAF5868499.1 putative mfs monocarboxylate transporter protein [Botrytis fragariae]